MVFKFRFFIFIQQKILADKILLWIDLNSKAGQEDWAEVSNLVKKGENVISFDFRGTGEDRMKFEATSSEYLKFAVMDSTQIYFNPFRVFLQIMFTTHCLLAGHTFYK